MKKKILLAKGESKYEVLRVASDQIAEGFMARGYEVEMVDLMKSENIPVFYEKMQQDYSFIFSLQCLCFEVEYEDGRPILSTIKSPYIGWIFDDIIYHDFRLKNAVYDNVYGFTIDQEQVRVIQTMFSKVKNVNFLYHGGFPVKKNEARDQGKAGAEINKDIDVLFSCNLGVRPEIEEYMGKTVPIEAFLMQGTLKKLKENPEQSTRKAMAKVLEEVGESLTGELLKELETVIALIDQYIRWECKYKVLEELLKAGIKVMLVGDGKEYEDFAEKYPGQLSFQGGADIQDVVQLMARAKIIMNPIPTYTEGAHERVFTSMLCRAICFTPWNEHIEAHFQDRLSYIRMNHLEEMTDEVKFILEHPETVENRIEDNYRYALSNHTWEKRGEDIIDFYESQIVPKGENR